MSFRFTLEPLLRLRRSQQRQRELELQNKTNEVERLRFSLNAIEAEASRIVTLAVQGRTAAEIQFDQERLRTLTVRRHEVAEALDRAIASRDQAASEFRDAWKKRETLETLQQHARETYLITESRRQQLALDDYFLARKLTDKK